jgi:uncharacterized protein YndB with AHSA1/START domain
MMGEEIAKEWVFKKDISIGVVPSVIWHLLTHTAAMKQWMSEAVTDIITDWTVGGPFIIRGQLYKKPFENTGTVLSFQPEHLLEYTHLSSLSKLPDVPESYCRFSFGLEKVGDATRLTLTISNFPTETIYRHLAFYWSVTLELLKKHIESNLPV